MDVYSHLAKIQALKEAQDSDSLENSRFWRVLGDAPKDRKAATTGMSARGAIERSLNAKLEDPYKATDEVVLFISTPEVRCVRNYGREVYVFLHKELNTLWIREGFLYRIGDAGKGRGWKERFIALFLEALEVFKAYHKV